MKNKKLMVSVLAGFLALLMLLTLLVGLIPTPASAASSSQIKSEINDLKKQKKEIQSQIDALESQIDNNMSEMEKYIAQKDIIDQEIGLLNQQILNINAQIASYGLLIADKQDELDMAQARLEELSAKNKERIRAMEENGSLSYWSVLFKANSFADLLDRLNMIEEIAASDKRRLDEMNQAAALVAQAREELEVEKADLETTKAELGTMQDELEVKRAEADEVLVKLNAKAEEYEKLVHDAEEDEEALLAEIAKKEKEYNTAKAKEEEERRKKEEEERKKREEEEKKKQEANKQNGSSGSSSSNSGSSNNSSSGSNAPSSSATWKIPCKYKYLSSPYGWRTHPVYGDRRFHSGVDLAASKGTPIYASRSGTVTAATYNKSSGYYVTINHGDGFSSSYLHMTHYIVSKGQKVSQGDVIGYVGSTGVSTGNHLHFSIYYDGSSVNPANYINFY